MATFYQDQIRQRVKNPQNAFLLALLLGPVGMFYATVTWAAIMLFMNIALGLVTYGLAIVILWPIGARIAYRAVRTRNQKFLRKQNECPDQFSLSEGQRPQKRITKLLGIVGSNDPSETISVTPKGNATHRNRNALIKRGVDIIRTAGTKRLWNDLSGSWPKTQFTRIISNFRTRKPSLPSIPLLKRNEEAFNTFELRLRSLKALRDKGLVDELEFKNKKKAILDEL